MSEPPRDLEKWLVNAEVWAQWRADLVRLTREHARRFPRELGLPAAEAKEALHLSKKGFLAELVEDAGLELVSGRIRERPM